MTTYLDYRPRTLAAIAAAFVAFVAAASLILHGTNYGAPCIGDDGAPCLTEAEYADVLARLDVLRSERGGDRFANTCAVVEHGPTGPEPTVNLGRTVTRCADGTTYVTEWSY